MTLSTLEQLGLAEVDLAALKSAGVVGQLAKVVKVIKSGELTKAVKLNGIGATAGAKAAIEGGRRQPGLNGTLKKERIRGYQRSVDCKDR